MSITNFTIKTSAKFFLFLEFQIRKIRGNLRPDSGFGIWGLGFSKTKKYFFSLCVLCEFFVSLCSLWLKIGVVYGF